MIRVEVKEILRCFIFDVNTGKCLFKNSDFDFFTSAKCKMCEFEIDKE